MPPILPWLALPSFFLAASAQQAGSFVQAGDTLVSAMMVRHPSRPRAPLRPRQMFLGNDEMVYILDKTEGNAVQIDGHPAWASVWCVSSGPSFCPPRNGNETGTSTRAPRRR